MHQSIRAYWFTFTEPLEGRVDFMYLDRRGWVSTGIGNKVDETSQELSAPTADERARSLAQANEVTWTVDGRDASADEVAETGAFDDPTMQSVLAQRLGEAGFVVLGD